MPTPGNTYTRDGVTYTSSNDMMAMDYYKRAKRDGSHEKAAKEKAGETYPEGTPEVLQYKQLPQHHLNANDKSLAKAGINNKMNNFSQAWQYNANPQDGSPLKNMLK